MHMMAYTFMVFTLISCITSVNEGNKTSTVDLAQEDPCRGLGKDLRFVHETMLKDSAAFNHDAAIKKIGEETYQKLQLDVDRCRSVKDYIGVISRYFAALHDPHVKPRWDGPDKFASIFFISTGKELSSLSYLSIPQFTTGIILKRLNDSYYVWEVDRRIAKDRRVQKGHELLGCDGQSVSNLMSQEILPYIPFTDVTSASYKQAANFFIRWTTSAGESLRCTFRDNEDEYDVVLRWQIFSQPDSKNWEKPVYELLKRPYGHWITLRSLAGYDPSTIQQLKRFVADAPLLRNDKTIVLDVRGNHGGDSTWGDLWTEGIFGAQPPDPTPGEKSLFWASDRNIEHIKRFSKGLQDRPNSQMHRLIKCAEARPGKLVPIDCSISSKNSLSKIVTPKISRTSFRGRVIVLTDFACFSSAETLIGNLKEMPRTIQAGLSTDSSTIYGDIRFDMAPSKHFWFTIPTKVFPYVNGGKPHQPDLPLMFSPEEELRGEDSLAIALEKWIKETGD